ncbi:MAG: hypothetical protein OCC46_01175 [Pseudodesulfovibrio sp.]
MMSIINVHDIYKPLQQQNPSPQFDTVAALRTIRRFDRIEAQQVVLDNATSRNYPEQTSGKVVNTSG